jgi:hypothetical protein
MNSILHRHCARDASYPYLPTSFASSICTIGEIVLIYIVTAGEIQHSANRYSKKIAIINIMKIFL